MWMEAFELSEEMFESIRKKVVKLRWLCDHDKKF